MGWSATATAGQASQALGRRGAGEAGRTVGTGCVGFQVGGGGMDIP